MSYIVLCATKMDLKALTYYKRILTYAINNSRSSSSGIVDDVEKWFDTSNYNEKRIKRPFHVGINKKKQLAW